MSVGTATLVPSATVQLSATAKDQLGNALSRVLTWSSSDVATATVSSSGTVSGVAPGTATITAAVDGKSASATITVLDGAVVSSTGATLSLRSGEVQILVPADALTSPTNLSVVPSTAFASDARVVKGTPFDFGPTGTTFAKPVSIKIKYDPANLPQGTEEAALQLHLSTNGGWQPLPGSVADLSTHTVTAEVSHFSVYAILTPLPVAAVTIRGPPEKPIVDEVATLTSGDTEQLTATPTDSQGATLSNRAISWTSTDTTVATVSDGLVAAMKPGSTTVGATAGGVASRITVVVSPIPVAGVAVTFSSQSIQVGQTTQASAKVTDAAGHVLTGRDVSWVSDNPSVASVSTTGVVTAVALGTAQISGTTEGKTGGAQITVTQIPIASLALSPATTALVLGQTQQLTVTPQDATGNNLAGRTVNWVSSNPAVLSVAAASSVSTASGATMNITAAGVGTAVITATSEAAPAASTAVISVSPIPVARITVTPSAASLILAVAPTQQLIATPTDANGNALTGRAVAWSSSAPAVATVDGNGFVTAVAAGSTTITASSEGKTATSVITVAVTPVATVTVGLSASSITAVGTAQATATTLDTNNGVLTGRSIAWISGTPSVATVDASGAITAVAPGTTTITATSEGKSGAATLTVTPAPVASIAIAPPSTTIVDGSTQQLVATTEDAHHNLLTGRPIEWSSDAPNVATVSSSGLVTALASGSANISATSEGKTAAALLTVLPTPVSSVSLSAAMTSVVLGQTQQLTAVPKDASGRTLTGRTVHWVSSAPAILALSAASSVSSANGATIIVTAAGIGTAIITATSEAAPSVATPIITVNEVPVATVTVNPSAVSLVLAIATTQQLTATLKDASDHILTGRSVIWSSSAPAVAIVDANGFVTAVSSGSTTVTASSAGKTGTSSITVSETPVAAVTVSLSASSITALGTAQATATTLDANNGVLTGRPVVWSSGTPSVAIIDATGSVTAVAPGTTTITATSQGKSGTASLTVTPAPVASIAIAPPSTTIVDGSTQQLVATTEDAHHNVLTGRQIEWSSDEPNVATVSSTGLVTAVAPGVAKIAGVSETAVATAVITVTPIPIATINVTLASPSVVAGLSTQASVIALDIGGNALTGRVVTWTSDNTSIATVSATGLVTSLAPGSANITATSEGKSGHATLAVTPVPVATVIVSPGSQSVTIGATVQLTATTKAGNGNTLTGRVVTWASTDAAIASVDVNGLVTAHAIGSATINATSEGITGSSSITVTPVPVASVTVSLTPASITAVGTSQASAVTRDGAGNALAGRAISWSSDNTSVATVSAQGFVTAVAVGTANIIATSEGKTGSASLTVTDAPVATVTVNPPSATVLQGQTEQLTATLEDAHHNGLTRPVTWQSSNSAIASVSVTGLVTASMNTGTVTVTATSEGQSGTSAITVTLVPVASISVALSQSSINVAQITQATATLRDAAGTALTGRTVVWSSSNTGVATVSSGGVVTALAVGNADIIASSGGQSGNATLAVTAIPVASVTVALAANPIQIGQTTQAAATTRDVSNNVLSGRAITWLTDNASVATVSGSGLVTAVGAGTANITATSEGKSGSASLTVIPVPVASLALSSPTTPMVLGQSQQLTAIPRDASVSLLSGRVVNWVSSNPAVLSVSASSSISTSTGATITVTAAGIGTAIVTATSESAPSVATPVITVNPIPVATVSVTPSSANLFLGVTSTQQLTATVRDAGNTILTGRTVTWSSSAPSVANVDANGFITAVGGGSTTITATSEGVSGTSSITVTIPVATVTVSPSSVTLPVTGTHQLVATTSDANNNPLSGRAVVWSSNNSGVASVNGSGVVTAVSVGQATITASSEGKSGTSTITVTPVAVNSVTVSLNPTSITAVGTSQGTATPLDGSGNPLTGRAVSWSSSNTAVAIVSPTGLVTALATGTTNIVATSEGKFGSAPLMVTPAPVASVVVSPTTASLVLGITPTQQLATVLSDSKGELLTGRTVTWSSSNSAAATVDGNGLVAAVAPGSATITATSEGRAGTSSITVAVAPVASVSVSLGSSSITAVGTTQASATIVDANGHPLTGRTVTWTSSNTGIATVDAQGAVTAVAVGTTSITASSEGKTGSATLTVTQAPVASVTVTPSSATLAQGDTEQFGVTLKDAHNNVLTRSVTWSSSDETVATVTQSGLVHGAAPGSAVISAVSEGQTGSASITVSQIPIATVSVALASSTVTDVQTTQATATLRDGTGNVLTDRTVTWTSDNTAVATVSSTGVVTPVAPGSAQIRAASGGQIGSASLTVIPHVASVTVTPPSANVVIGATSQLAAQTKDAGNNPLSGRTVTWTSSDNSVVTVSPSGLVNAVALGNAIITATSEVASGTSTVTVVPVPVALVTVSLTSTSITAVQTTQAIATTRDGNGTILNGRVVTWSSGNPAIASVSSTGLVTAMSAGSAQIIAVSEGKTGSATLTVTPALVATVTLSSPATPVLVGATQVLTATPRDANGGALSGRTVNWTSSNTAILTVSGTSSVSTSGGATITVSAVGIGGATITAISESAPAVTTPTVTVNPVPVATVGVALTPASITAVGTSQATSTTRDANSNVLTGRVVTWNSDNVSVATVNAQGLVTAVAVGVANIIATSEGQTGSAAVTVTPAPVASVTVSLAPSSITAVQTAQATATLLDSKGRVLSDRSVSWSSDDTGIATVSASTGLLTGVSVGTVNIVASSEGKTGSATVTVTQAPVATVSVSLALSSINSIQTTQATATLRDAQGRSLSGRTVSWTSSNNAVATVSSTTGLVTAVSPGTANINATSEGQTGGAPLTVIAAPVTTVAVSTPTTPMIIGATQVLTATPKDANGTTLIGRTVNWVSSNSAVLTVSAASSVSTSAGAAITVTALGTGSATITASSESAPSAPTLSITVTVAPVATVTVSASTTPMIVGGSQQLTATTRDANSNVVTGRVISWASSNSDVLTVSPSGSTATVTATGVGTATITATSETVTSAPTSAITVNPVPVATVNVTLVPTSITAVGTSQATATTLDSNNNPLTGRTVVWSSGSTAIATVDASGVVTANAVGTTSIIATSEGKSGSATITVTPAPVATVTVSLTPSSINSIQTSQATATLLDAKGRTLTGRNISWISDNTAVATVSATAGLVTAVSPGAASIAATSEGKTGSASVTVTAAPVASVTLSTPSTPMIVGGTQILTATPKNGNGTDLAGRTVNWSSSNTAVLTVSATSSVSTAGGATIVVTAVGTGQATITATSESAPAATTPAIAVNPIPVATVTVNPNQTTLVLGITPTQQMTAVTEDAGGNALVGRAVSWTTSNAAAASVDGNGLVTAVGAGTTTITATSEGKAGMSAVTVMLAPVATVTVSAPTTPMIVGASQQLSATTADANGNSLTGRPITWSSSNTAVVTVTASGTPVTITAVGVGSATITASSESISSGPTPAITVNPIPVASVTVSLSPTSITAVETSQATATTLDGDGNPLTGRAVTWTSDNTAIATVDGNGLVSAVAAGTVNITATSETKTGSAPLVITQAPVDTVKVSLASSPINAVQTTQATATLVDSKGRILAGRAVSWSSSDNSVATVSPSGLVSAAAEGQTNIVATSEGKTANAPLTVTAAPVASVTVSPPSASIISGNTEQLTATLKDTHNNILTGRTVTWSSSNNGVATVSGAGLVTAVATGNATITATSETIHGTSAITVTIPATTATLLRRSVANPRYFENASGQVVYLTGSHTWSNLQDNGTVDPPAAFNYTAYLDTLEAHHHNFFRLWTWEQSKWTAEIAADYWITPGPFLRTTGQGNALDGKPKFDLTQFDQSYFDRLRSRVLDAAARGIYVSVMLFDGWSVAQKGGVADNFPWKGHPFNGANNVNGIDGDTNGDGQGLEVQTLGNSAVTNLQDAYVRKVIDAVGDLDNVLYEISNESDPSSKDWQYHMIQLIRSYETKHHPVGVTAMWPNGLNSDLTNSTADWVSLTSSLENPTNATGAQVLITDTDHICGVCGTTSWIWKSFVKGQNPILMDKYDGAAIGLGAEDNNMSEGTWQTLRKNLGYARDYSLRMDLSAAVPHGDLVLTYNGAVAATGYCLAKPGSQYVVYLPDGGNVAMDLSAVTGSLAVEWLNPATGNVTQSGTVAGGASVTLTAPFNGPAVVFVH